MPRNLFHRRWLAAVRIHGYAPCLFCLVPFLAALAQAQTTVQIIVGTNTYVPFSPLAKPGTKVFIDAAPEGKTPVHAMQRSLGYREVEYKALVFRSLAFEPAAPKTNDSTVVFDYSAQTGMTNLVGYLTAKNVPILVGPDGEPYIADGHHTTAGYLSPVCPIRQIVPGQKRLLFGHIEANSFDAAAGPKPVTDDWWKARGLENNAYLFGTNGNQLAIGPGQDAASLGPVMPSTQPMPSTPSAIGAANRIPMGHDRYRSLTWGMADGITLTASDITGRRIAGFNKKAPSGGEINFVEFCWADFFRNRIWWDDSKAGSPLNSTNRDANVIAAPLGFYAAVANGIALAKSEAYRDQFGRSLRDYTDASLFPDNTVKWAAGSLTNTWLAGTNFFHLYWFDDSMVKGAVTPPPKAVNILHIGTEAGMVISNQFENLSTVYINEAGSIKTSWRDARIKTSVLRYPAASGTVTLLPGAELKAGVIVGHGTFAANGTVTGRVMVNGGTLQGPGTINDGLTLGKEAHLVLASPSDVLRVEGGIGLNGTVTVAIAKAGETSSSARIEGAKALFLKGTLVVTGDGAKLAAGDTFKLFQAASYQGAFGKYELPPLPAGLVWNTAQLAVDGTLSVSKG